MTTRPRARACARMLLTWRMRTTCGAKAKRWLASASCCSSRFVLSRGENVNLFARRRFFGFAAGGRVRPRSQKLDTLRDDFRALALAAAVLVLEFSRAQPAFNINLPPFAEILTSHRFRRVSRKRQCCAIQPALGDCSPCL